MEATRPTRDTGALIMRWAIFGVSCVASILGSFSSRADDSQLTVAGTEWGSAPGCKVEVVRFYADGTAHILFDSAYDFVDADEATWQQTGNALVLKVDGEEYRGRIEGGRLRLARAAGGRGQSGCAFEPSGTTPT
jgi:hypothetical protein